MLLMEYANMQVKKTILIAAKMASYSFVGTISPYPTIFLDLAQIIALIFSIYVTYLCTWWLLTNRESRYI